MRAVLAAMLSFTFLGAALAKKPARVALNRRPVIEAPLPAFVAPPPSKPEPTATVMVTQSRRWGLFGGGVTLFVAGWAADLGASYGLSNPGASHAIIPLIGPLVQMADKWTLQMQTPTTGDPALDAQINGRVSAVNDQIQTAAYVVLAVDFALQLTGVVMAIVGAATKSTRVSYEKSPPIGLSTVKWTVLPGPSPTVALRF